MARLSLREKVRRPSIWREMHLHVKRSQLRFSEHLIMMPLGPELRKKVNVKEIGWMDELAFAFFCSLLQHILQPGITCCCLSEVKARQGPDYNYV